jgi:hypothetical protein
MKQQKPVQTWNSPKHFISYPKDNSVLMNVYNLIEQIIKELDGNVEDPYSGLKEP